jgi:hypothetical protein
MLERALAVVVVTVVTVVAAAGLAPPVSSQNNFWGTLLSGSAFDASSVPLSADRAALVRYTTLRTSDAPGESTGAVFVPAGTPPAGGWPVVSYAHGTVGVDDTCTPSNTGVTSVERPAVEQWLQAGYAVAATDYAGLGTPGVHSYLDGPAAAANAIDIVRAAHELFGDSLSPKWLVVGFSQGGNAIYFAARDAKERLPELDFRGAVAIAAPTQLDSAFPLFGPAVPQAAPQGLVNYTMFTLAGLDDQRPELNVRQYLTPRGVDILERAKVTCNFALSDYLKSNPTPLASLLSRPLSNPELEQAFHRIQGVPVDAFDGPILVTQSVSDQVVPAPLTAAHVAEMSRAGTDYQYVTVAAPDHIASLSASMPASLDFIERVME